MPAPSRPPPHGGMSPARKAGRDGGRSGRLARGPGSPGTRLSAGRRRRPPPAGPCARGSAESLPPGALRTVPGRAGPGWEPPAREIFVSQWVRGRASRSQRVRASRAQPAGEGGNPQPVKPRPPLRRELLVSGHSLPPILSTPPPGHRLHIQTRSGTHPETHKDTLACGPSP